MFTFNYIFFLQCKILDLALAFLSDILTTKLKHIIRNYIRTYENGKSVIFEI